MTKNDSAADEAALLRAIDQLPDELFTAYQGGWQDSISLALLDAVYSVHPSYEAQHPERGITSRVFRFAQEHPEAENSLRSLAELDESAIREIMGYGKTGVTLRSEAVLAGAHEMLALTEPIVEAKDFTGARLRDVRRIFSEVPGLGKVSLTYFATNLGVPGAHASPLLTRFVARYAYGDEVLRLHPHRVVSLVSRAYRKNHRGAESVSHFEHALWLGERNGHAQ